MSRGRAIHAEIYKKILAHKKYASIFISVSETQQSFVVKGKTNIVANMFGIVAVNAQLNSR